MRVLRVYPTPSPPTRGLCERHKLPWSGLGWSPIRRRLLHVLCDFTRVCSMQVGLLSLEGSKSSLQSQRVTQKQSMFVECWC